MTVGTLLALLLATGAIAFILAPLFRGDAAQQERRTGLLSEEEDLVSQRDMATSALRDLEDDRATGKIGDQDYAASKTELTARAVALMKRLDEIEAGRANPRPAPVRREPPATS